jgi:uncharacterized protein (DUF433 family)
VSKVVSVRLKDDQVERLARVARRFGRTVSETAAQLLDEALRQGEFAFIEFRDSAVGRQAYLKGTRLAVWQVTALARHVDGDPKQTAEHLEIPAIQVQAALAYAAAYPAEINAAIADAAVDPDALARLIPNIEVVAVDATAP